MNTPSPPPAPDANAIANAQQGANIRTATTQRDLNAINQQGPTGSLSYGTDPSTGRFTATQSLSPELQRIFGATQGAAGNLAQNTAGMYSQAPNINPSEAIDKAMSMQQQYLDPWFKQQQNVTNSNLQSQGLAPGDAAYQMEQKALQQNQTQAMQGALAQFEPMAFNQQVQSYELPAQTIGALEGLQPGVNLTNTPQTGVPATDVNAAYGTQTQAQQYSYGQQMQNNSARMGGLFGIPSALLGGWAQSGGLQQAGSAAMNMLPMLMAL